jgi:hypothetical protein
MCPVKRFDWSRGQNSSLAAAAAARSALVFAGIKRGGNHVGQALQGGGNGPQRTVPGSRLRRVPLLGRRSPRRVEAGRSSLRSRQAGRISWWAGHSRQGRVEARSSACVPLHPVVLHAGAANQGSVVTAMAMLKHASVHPRHFVVGTDGNQRPPQLLVEHDGGKAPVRAHPGAQMPALVTAHCRCRWFTDSLSIGSGVTRSAWVRMQYPPTAVICRGFAKH